MAPVSKAFTAGSKSLSLFTSLHLLSTLQGVCILYNDSERSDFKTDNYYRFISKHAFTKVTLHGFNRLNPKTSPKKKQKRIQLYT